LDLLGKILIEEGFCSEAEIQLAHEEQLKGDDRKLGIILVEMGALNRAQLVYCLAKQRNKEKFKKKPTKHAEDSVLLGRILIEEHFCSLYDVQQAHHAQLLGDERKLGEILIEKQAITESTLKIALEKQEMIKKGNVKKANFKKAS